MFALRVASGNQAARARNRAILVKQLRNILMINWLKLNRNNIYLALFIKFNRTTTVEVSNYDAFCAKTSLQHSVNKITEIDTYEYMMYLLLVKCAAHEGRLGVVAQRYIVRLWFDIRCIKGGTSSLKSYVKSNRT